MSTASLKRLWAKIPTAEELFLVPKLLYFTYWGAFAFARPFFPVYYEHIGLARADIGILTGIPPFIIFCASSVFTAVADRYNKHKLIMLVNALTSTLIIYVKSLCTDFWLLVPVVISFAIVTAPLTALIDANVLLLLKDDKNLYGRQRLWGAVSWGTAALVSGYLLDLLDIRILFFEYIISIFFFAMLVGVFLKQHQPVSSSRLSQDPTEQGESDTTYTNAIELDVVETEPSELIEPDDVQKEKDCEDPIEKQSLSTELKEVSLEHSEEEEEEIEQASNEKESMLQKDDDEEEEEKQKEEEHDSSVVVKVQDTSLTFWQKLQMLFFNRSLIMFLGSVFVMGMGAAIIQNFLFLYLETSLGASRTLMGLSLTFTVLVEIPFFFFSKYLLEKLGMRGMVVLAHVCYIIRVVAYTMLPNAWAVLPFELLHGTTFAAMWAAGVAYSNSKAPPGLEATAQGLFSGVYTGLGQGVGAMVGGWVYQHFGPIVMFGGAAVVVSCSLVFFIVTQWIIVDCETLASPSLAWKRLRCICNSKTTLSIERIN